jgi:hypothetical protein
MRTARCCCNLQFSCFFFKRSGWRLRGRQYYTGYKRVIGTGQPSLSSLSYRTRNSGPRSNPSINPSSILHQPTKGHEHRLLAYSLPSPPLPPLPLALPLAKPNRNLNRQTPTHRTSGGIFADRSTGSVLVARKGERERPNYPQIGAVYANRPFASAILDIIFS